MFPRAVIALLLCAAAGTAQVTVQVTLDHEQFLRDEPLPVHVRITNRSGQTLHLGQDNDWLSFALEGADHGTVTRLAEAPVQGEFAVESAKVATREVDLAPCYDLSQPGRYQVTATVRIRDWNEELTSKPLPFEIIRGTKLWEQDFGVPAADGVPEARRYVLQQAHYNKSLKLYARVTDAADVRVLRVFPLGTLVSFSQPEAQVDKASNLHVLFQTGARSFLFHEINPNGDVVLRQSYDYSATRPTLRATEEGRIYVSGGMRRLTTSDIPPSLSGIPPASQPRSGASPTNAPATRPDTNAAPKKK